MLLTVAGVGLGYVLWLSSLRRTILLVVVAAACVYVCGVCRPLGPASRAQRRSWSRRRRYHRGHVFTAGHYYKLLDHRFYSEYLGPAGQAPHGRRRSDAVCHSRRRQLRRAAAAVEGRLPIRAGLHAGVGRSGTVLAILFPLGCLLAFQRDALLTCILGGYTWSTLSSSP